MDNLSLSLYFAKPVADVREPRKGGGYTIAQRPVRDPEMMEVSSSPCACVLSHIYAIIYNAQIEVYVVLVPPI